MPDRRTTNTRADLLAAADSLLARGGPEAVTLRAVGAATGVSRTAPYRHFDSKEALLSAVASANLTELTAQMQAATARTNETPGLLVAAQVFVEFAWAHPNHYRLEFGGDYAVEPSDELFRAATQCTNYFADLVKQAQRDGVIVDGDGPDLTALLWVILHGLATAQRTVTRTSCDGQADHDALSRVLKLAFERLAPP